MKDVTPIRVDPAENVIQVHGVDQRGKAVLKKQFSRWRFVEFFADLPACPIGMEACSSAHHRVRQLDELDHQVKLIALQFVKPYVKALPLGISQRGDAYLRTLLIHDARSVVRVAERKAGDLPTWLEQLIVRRHKNVTAVALENENAHRPGAART